MYRILCQLTYEIHNNLTCWSDLFDAGETLKKKTEFSIYDYR